MTTPVQNLRMQCRSYTTSLNFNGTSDYATSPVSIAGTSGFSIAFWFFMPQNGAGTYNRVYDYISGSTFPNYSGCRCLINVGRGGLDFDIGNGSGYGSCQSPAGSISAGQWYHLVFTNLSGFSTLYINGQQANTATGSTYVAPTAQTFTFARESGGSGTANFATCNLMEFIVKDNYVMTSADVSNLYLRAIPPSSLKTYYKFNSSVADTSGVSGSATLHGTSYSTNVPKLTRTSLI